MRVSKGNNSGKHVESIYLSVDGSPLVLVTPSLHLKLHDVVRGVSREAERLWLGDRRDDEHVVFQEVAKVSTVEQVS